MAWRWRQAELSTGLSWRAPRLRCSNGSMLRPEISRAGGGDIGEQISGGGGAAVG